MTKVKSRRFIQSSCTSISTSALFILLAATTGYTLPVQATPQSMLDPYADIQPSAAQPDKKPEKTKKISKAKNSAKPLATSSDLGNRTSAKNPSSPSKQTNSPSFLSGIKEVQQGAVTSFKAAGQGIVNGTKAAGAKIAAGTRSIAGGAKALGGKVKNGANTGVDNIASEPKAVSEKAPSGKAKKKGQTQIADNPNIDPAVASMPELPGKPLGSLVDSLPPAKRKHLGKQQNVIARTFNKLNPFSKNKGQTPVNISATDHQKGVNQ